MNYFNYKVRLDDLDYMGLVGNSHWLTFLERARIELLETIGFPFSTMMKNKIGGVVSEAKIKFIKPAFFDDEVKISIEPHSPFNKGIILRYLVTNQRDEECLNADITIIFVDASGKSINIPDDIRIRLCGIEK